MTTTLTLTFDYLCPFARNATEHVLAALQLGADLEVTFSPFSQAQGARGDGQSVWDDEDPLAASGMLALAAGVAVRDMAPELFHDAHRELFAARHDHAGDIRDRTVVAEALQRAGVTPSAVWEHIDTHDVLGTLQTEHEQAVTRHDVWGVPTFITGGRAVFVRLMERPSSSIDSVELIEGLVGWVANKHLIHEFKQTVLPA